jgi:hypothetical protein
MTECLGSSISNAFTMRIDEDIAKKSIKIFDLKTIPAIRGPLPNEISQIRFCSDISNIPDIKSVKDIDNSELLHDLMPTI